MFLGAILLLCLLHVCGGAPDPDREMCYSRQHRDVAVSTHAALEQKGTVMVTRAKPSEKDCILTCCSEDVGPGLKCNLVVYKPPQRSGDLNCELFHCPSERDCPLMTASPGVNTYNIFKGLTHPTTKVSGRITAKAAAPPLSSTTPTASVTTPTTPVTTPTACVTTPTTPAPTTPSSSTSTSSTTTSDTAVLTESESPGVLETVAMTTASTTTATSTTQSSTTTTTKSSSTKAPRIPVKPNRAKKPSHPSRPETHSLKPVRVSTAPPTSSTPAPPTTTTTTTSTTPPTTTTTTTPAPTSTSSPPPPPQLSGDPRRRGFGRPAPALSLPGKPKVSRVMWKNSLVAIVVITLVFLALILSLVARKAMESFDRRHYTRLELNDLHYEV